VRLNASLVKPALREARHVNCGVNGKGQSRLACRLRRLNPRGSQPFFKGGAFEEREIRTMRMLIVAAVLMIALLGAVLGSIGVHGFSWVSANDTAAPLHGTSDHGKRGLVGPG
jgi:hypothetical protein